MRQIKFRAWDTKKEEFVQDGLLFIDCLTGIAWDNERKPNKNLILMQFTGLLDKNGKEIYEGDIVQVSNEDGEQRHGGVVKYIAPKFFVMDGEKSGLFLTNKYEVIGNIYETPNLI